MHCARLRGRRGLAWLRLSRLCAILQLSAEDSRAGRGELSSEADAGGNKWGNKLKSFP